MRIILFVLLILNQTSVFSQNLELDSIDFNDELKFIRTIEYTTNGRVKSIEYDEKIGHLKKLENYNSKQQIVKEQLWNMELLQEIKYSYFENRQIVKRHDVLNNLELSVLLNVNIKYPVLARENKIEGKIFVEIKYNDNCIPIEFLLLNSLGHGIDKEVNTKMKTWIKLSQKYKVHFKNCKETKEPFMINFKLE